MTAILVPALEVLRGSFVGVVRQVVLERECV